MYELRPQVDPLLCDDVNGHENEVHNNTDAATYFHNTTQVVPKHFGDFLVLSELWRNQTIS